MQRKMLFPPKLVNVKPKPWARGGAIVGKLFGAIAPVEYIGSPLVNNNAGEIAAPGKQGL